MMHLKRSYCVVEYNILILTIKDSQKMLDKELYKSLNNLKSLFLAGIWFNKKLYRPSEYNLLLNLDTNIKIKPILLINKLIKTLQLSLILKK